MDSSAKILAKRYARAYMCLGRGVYSAALEKAGREKLDGLRRVFHAARPNLKVLTHPAVNSGVKLEVLAKLLGAANTGPAAGFAALLVRKGRFGLIDEIMRECLSLFDKFCGVTRAEVYSRYPLSAGEMKRINDLLSGPERRKIIARNITAERVLGGFEIKIGDTLIDATVRGRLDALRAGLRKG
ncbi:MAG TPA: ATP synthase F1 subunit delta [Elusimicrobiales bacterium]|nr:ATP synthase F1 subunit delta [Elusimicrobiales bacterium]